MISDDHRLIFIHVPKTGGFSVRKHLRDHYGGIYNVDAYAEYTPDKHPFPLGLRYAHMTLLEHIRQGHARIGYRTFAFVRNPWDRAASEYEWRKRRTRTHGDRPKFRTFETFVNALAAGWEYQDDDERHTFNQSFFLKDGTGAVGVDFVGRFERLESDLLAFLKDFGRAPRLDLPWKNASGKVSNEYRSYYTTRTMKQISNLYEEDIDLFEYTF